MTFLTWPPKENRQPASIDRGQVVRNINKLSAWVRHRANKYVLLLTRKVRGLLKHHGTELTRSSNYLMDHSYASVPLLWSWGPATEGSLINSFIANSIKCCLRNIFHENSHITFYKLNNCIAHLPLVLQSYTHFPATLSPPGNSFNPFNSWLSPPSTSWTFHKFRPFVRPPPSLLCALTTVENCLAVWAVLRMRAARRKTT